LKSFSKVAEYSANIPEHSAKVTESSAKLAEHSAKVTEHFAKVTECSVKVAEHSANSEKLNNHSVRNCRVFRDFAKVVIAVFAVGGLAE
jgi:hypothetical protein